MVAGIGLRTIWITLRAVNYTDRAFRAAIDNTKKLQGEEKKHMDALLRQRKEIMANISAGLLYTAMGAIMIAGFYQLAQSTQLGASYMQQLNQSLTELKTQMADAFFVVLKPALDILQMFIGFMKQYPVISRVIAVLAVYASTLLLLVGLYKIFSGAIALVNNSQAINLLMTKILGAEQVKNGFIVRGATISYQQLGVAIFGALGIFLVAMTALRGMNPIFTAAIAIVLALATAFWFLWAGISAATLGVGLAIGGAAAGAAVATAMNVQDQMNANSYAGGTRALPKTGMFLGHKGEVVYNPSTGRPTQIANEVEGTHPSSTTQQIQVNIDTINTKADVDDLDKELSRNLRKVANRSR